MALISHPMDVVYQAQPLVHILTPGTTSGNSTHEAQPFYAPAPTVDGNSTVQTVVIIGM